MERSPPPGLIEGVTTRSSLTNDFRYGIVLGLSVMTIVFALAAPTEDWALAIGLAMQTTVLAVAATTSRSPLVRRRPTFVSIIVLALVFGCFVAAISPARWLVATVWGLVAIATMVIIARGGVLAMRERGVSAEVILAAITLYILVGVTFAFVITVGDAIAGGTWFAQTDNPSMSDRLYYSFITLTTTGYGDLTPATRGGHAVSVLEALIGQLYLVTIVGLLVGGFVRRKQVAAD